MCKNCQCSPYARFFDTLGNTTRLYILNFLRAGPKNVSEIVKQTGLEQTQVSHALKQLEECGFVTSQQKGKFRVYSIRKSTVDPLMKLIDSHVQQYCAKHAKPCCCKEVHK
jgi:ArsR family transcriptional regulator, cadmium/lead-responsive transcriptional repressor